MAKQGAGAREDQFLGSLLGMAIGDALGQPVVGLTADEIRARHGAVSTYLPLDDPGDGPIQGEITAITEIVLCLVESITTNAGMIDPENINARLAFLANGPSRAWMSEAVIAGIAQASQGDGLVPGQPAEEPELAVAIRGIPVGLLHAVGGYDSQALTRDAALVARLTHGGESQARLARLVGEIIEAAARHRELPALDPGADDIGEAIAGVAGIVRDAPTFEDGVSGAIGLGGRTNELGALAGAMAGALAGASDIPQDLIDGLDARIYLSLAAPWFYRAAIRRAGTVIDLRVVE